MVGFECSITFSLSSPSNGRQKKEKRNRNNKSVAKARDLFIRSYSSKDIASAAAPRDVWWNRLGRDRAKVERFFCQHVFFSSVAFR